MVDAVISVVAENLVKIARDEAVLLAGHREKLQDLYSELNAIRAVLQDAEMRQIKEEVTRIWLQDLKYVAYEIEDMLEEWTHVSNLSSSFSFLKHPIRKHKFGSKLNAIKQKLDKISDRKDRYHSSTKFQVLSDVSDRQTSSLVDLSSIIGRNSDIEKLKKYLISEEGLVYKKDEVPAISIVGMGGLGKTTLAHVAFNDEAIQNCFEKCIWVCVSNDFNAKDVMINIVKNGGGGICGGDDQVELIQKKVKELIGSKRYLLVLDDVWNEDESKWESLQRALNCGASGSRIIVTTRKRGVAHAIRSAYPLDLEVLSNDECWSIFTKFVFQGNNDVGDLEDVGRKIVEKCDGLPLAVKMTASAIWKKSRGKHPTRELLENILKSEIWKPQSEVDILPALLLSYSELPSHLKNCFCYCSLFEKDFVFEKDLLIRLWVAQGYVVAKDGEPKELECIAEEYFDELLDRSLFQEPREDEYGSITGCKMHDLVHDLAQWVAKTEFLAIKVNHAGGIPANLDTARHCGVLETLEWNRDISSVGVEDLRTLIYLSYERFNVPINVINRLQSVRVLSLPQVSIFGDVSIMKRLVHLSWTQMRLLPESFGKLKHLRYLDLSQTNIKVLPKSIGKLKHLRYLNLRKTKIKVLPESIGKLKHLTYLDLSETKIKVLPESIGKLKDLTYVDLEEMNLKVLPESIGKLKHLRHLRLSWTLIKRLPNTIISLSHLQTLNMHSCVNLVQLPDGIAEMGNLQTLDLHGCRNLVQLPDGIAEMGNLRHLDVESCDNLLKLSDGIGRLTLLQTLGGFPVARVEGGGGSNIGELGGLNQIRGSLEIVGLKMVVSTNEACTAKLKDKTSLSALTFNWDKRKNMRLMIDDYSGGHLALDVLEALLPPPQLESLKIRNYPGGSFPSWMGDATFFHRLREVSLWDCNRCTRLPSLGQLPCLKTLSIRKLLRVEKVGEEFLFGPIQGTSMVAFPQLENLYFNFMHNWNQWEKPIRNELGSTSGSPTTMPRLHKLSLENCPKLKELPCPVVFTTALQTLDIKGSPMLGLQFLPPNIKELTLPGVSTEKWLADCSSLPLLQYLNIVSDLTLIELPSTIIHLSLLQSLRITHCPNLVSLPEELIQMNSLQELTIIYCPKLVEKCKVGGCLWPRISHIPSLVIDDHIFSGGREVGWLSM